MWQETKHGLYKQFNFDTFLDAWKFMNGVADLAMAQEHYPRWENEWNVVQIWLVTRADRAIITDQDHTMAMAIDALIEHPSLSMPSENNVKIGKVTVFADGGSRGNPGPSASGFVVLSMDDKVLIDKGVYLGVTTNNQAEYTALKLALEECLKLKASEVQVYMDSLLVVNQMNGLFKIKNRELWPIHDMITQLSQKFKKISFQHVPREFNKLADAAVNRALDEALHIG